MSESRRYYRLISIIVILLIFTSISLQVCSNNKYNIDPVPLEKLLNDTLALIIDDKYDDASQLIGLALNITLNDPLIMNQHIRLYNSLKKTSILLKQSISIEQSVFNKPIEQAKLQIRNTYNQLFSEKDDIEKYIELYMRSLSKYVRDKPSFFLYKLKIEEKLKLLKTKLEDVLKRLEKIYDSLEKNISRGWIKILGELPENINAGDKIKLKLTLVPVLKDNIFKNETYNATISLIMFVGEYPIVFNRSSIIIPSTTEYIINIPPTRYILKKEIEIKREKGSIYYSLGRITIRVEVFGRDFILRGFRIIDFKIHMFKPRIVFSVPSYVHVNETVKINVKSYADTPLNVSIYIDKISNETNLFNTTIIPGNSSLLIRLFNVSVGYHTILFITSPSRKYLPERWSTALAITYYDIGIMLDAPRIVIGPPFSLNLRGYIKNPCNYTLIVLIDGNRVYERDFSGKEFDIVVESPLVLSSLFIWFKKLEIKIIPHNSSFVPTRYSLNILFINTFFIFLLIILTSIMYMHPSVISFISILFYRMHRAIIGERISRIDRTFFILKSSKTVSVSIRFRPFRLRSYYVSLINLLAYRVHPPHESETLREYLSRVKDKFPEPIYILINKLVKFFELELYSKIKIDFVEVKETFKKIKKMIRNET